MTKPKKTNFKKCLNCGAIQVLNGMCRACGVLNAGENPKKLSNKSVPENTAKPEKGSPDKP